jgi:hypothetical protein
MREARGVAVWPVGLVGGLMVEKCLVDLATGRVTGWNSAWRPERPFPLDMAAFAINLRLLLAQPLARFSFDVERGYQVRAGGKRLHLDVSGAKIGPCQRGDGSWVISFWFRSWLHLTTPR